jgi:hypothetical protein
LDRTPGARPRTQRLRELSQRFWQASIHSERSCRAFGVNGFRWGPVCRRSGTHSRRFWLDSSSSSRCARLVKPYSPYIRPAPQLNHSFLNPPAPKSHARRLCI